ncbi:MAG TPA: hypothetical protein VL974_14640 [Magnetospirillum sp.]|jgi:hypothetical protein|nr:hypothetical protein [Magnetospirillum sp.]
MIPQLILLLGALVALWLFFDWLKRAKPQAVARVVKRLGFGLLLVFGLWLVLTGKLAGLLAVVAGAAPWITRGRNLRQLWRTLFGNSQPAPGGASQVVSRFLRMELEHDSGRLEGEVLEGDFRGRWLSGLTRSEALALWQEVQVDGESMRLLAAWLERAWPDWRETETPSPPPPRSGMSLEEAREVLGISASANPDEIRAAHRRLMLANHPDHGGSTWIAARINQAKDVLLKAAASK